MNNMMNNMMNGDVFDIGQTVNGISRFVFIEGRWHYFEKRSFKEFEYDQTSLTNLIQNEDGLHDVNYLGNIFDQF